MMFLNGGLPVYTIERMIREMGTPFEDRAHIVYVNGAYRGEDAVGRLMHDFHCSDPRQMYSAKLAARVQYFKEEAEGVADMCKTMQTIVDRERNQAETDRSKQIALVLWNNGEHDLDRIAQMTFLTPDQVREAITSPRSA